MKIPLQWTFKNKDVVKNFDKHIREQLPWYDLATSIVVHFANNFISEGGKVYDVGASTGNISLHLRDILDKRKAHLIAIEESEDMVKEYRGYGQIIKVDACEFEYEPCDFIVCFLTLMFIPPRLRRITIKKMFKSLNEGGCMVIFDKFEPVNGYVASVMNRLTLSEKIKNNITHEEVLRKEMSLSGIQRPLSEKELPENSILIFQFGDFKGYVVCK